MLLDSSVTGMFIDRKIIAKYRFRLQKLDRPVTVRNINGTDNSAKTIIYQLKVNIYYKNYIKRIKIDIYNLGKTDMILRMLWLQMHNTKINWETKKVKITRYLSICERNIVIKKDIE